MNDLTPGAIVSVPCRRCAGRSDPACPDCAGQGIVLLRVAAHEAAAPEEELRRRGRRV